MAISARYRPGLLSLAIIIGASTTAGITIHTGSLLAPAYGEALPTSPTNHDSRTQWINPTTRPGEETNPHIQIEILDQPQAIPVGEELSLRVRISNNSESAIAAEQLRIQPRHADAEPTVETAQAVLAGTNGQYPYTAQATTLGYSIDAKSSVEVDLTIPTVAGDLNGFNIADPGAYPVTINIESTEGVHDSERFLLAVLDQHQSVRATTEDEESTPPATPVTLIFPLTTEVNIVDGETGDAPNPPPLILSNESIYHEISAGGRLRTLVDELLQARLNPALNQASCIAIDPALLHVLNRMSNGYSVGEQRPSSVSQNQRLRDSWLKKDEELPLETGQGKQAAQDFLVALRQLSDHCVVSLPWAQADINAVAATNNEWLLREALQRGNESIREILGTEPLDNVVISPNGYINSRAVDQIQKLVDSTTTDIEQAWRANNTPTEITAQPRATLTVLVADNNISSEQQSVLLSDNLQAVTYPSALASVLASGLDTPITTAYSAYSSRYDYTLDSVYARSATTDTALRLGLSSTQPTLIMAPAEYNTTAWLTTINQLFQSEATTPLGLADYLKNATISVSPENNNLLNPAVDPTVVSDTEVLRAGQQATHIDNLTQLLFSDPAITLTPYGFTEPLRLDVLRTLSTTGRRSLYTFDKHITEINALQSSGVETLRELNNSVSLIPPGNIYTRFSNNSPLLIVAKNGLPLPVDATIMYAGPEGVHIEVPEQLIIPAKGSITVQMMAELTDTKGRTDLQLWLANRDKVAISQPIDIGVQTRQGIFSAGTAATLLVLGLIAALFSRLFLRRRRARLAEEHRVTQAQEKSKRSVEKRLAHNRYPRNTSRMPRSRIYRRNDVEDESADPHKPTH
ncbi:hypothetical protein UL82_10730 [Corynebacterium kutscheri]|uniref:Secreted protein n=1 Tax=Corynebacterium kutscheri TaxID=35755 RepID=A0A0F6R259_9CORY|nr:DUF6049 family protein [Corynebacterium kutscheri]AKE42280.1 hypothetical protein UL82_10730 [Corynebacterium kutscheri]VEH05618.1 putative secreted protein [Corynebacterium kutscheri]VEH10624.1 putative secreted protein [Corynebacterium kutscheri]